MICIIITIERKMTYDDKLDTQVIGYSAGVGIAGDVEANWNQNGRFSLRIILYSTF